MNRYFSLLAAANLRDFVFSPRQALADATKALDLREATGLHWKIGHDRGLHPQDDRTFFVSRHKEPTQANMLAAQLNAHAQDKARFTTRQPVNPYSFQELSGAHIIMPAGQYSPKLIEALKNPQMPDGSSPASYVTARNMM